MEMEEVKNEIREDISITMEVYKKLPKRDKSLYYSAYIWKLHQLYAECNKAYKNETIIPDVQSRIDDIMRKAV